MKNLVTTSEDREAAIDNAKEQSLVYTTVYPIHTGKGKSKNAIQQAYIAARCQKKTVMRTMTVGALCASGFASVNNRGLLEVANDGDRDCLAALIGSRAVAHHTDAGNISDNALTEDGLVWFNNAMQGTGAGGYNTEVKAVRAARDVFKGKKQEAEIELDGVRKFTISRKGLEAFRHGQPA